MAEGGKYDYKTATTDARISNVPVEASDWTPPTRLFKDKAWDISFAAFNYTG